MKDSTQRAYAHERLGKLSLSQITELRKQQLSRQPQARTLPLVPQERGESLPLSHAQERLWFLHQLGTVGSAYNMPMALRLEGELNVAALELSILQLLQRHESLHARFESIEGTPRQCIEPVGSFALSLLDLTAMAAQERATEVSRQVREEAECPFDLTRGPMLRASLLKLATNQHVLLMTLHHIAADGWSLSIVLQEITVLYSAALRNEPNPLPALPIQYPDYAIWQRAWLRGPVLEQQLHYWKEHLRGAPVQLELPTDRPRPPIESFKGGRLKFNIPASLRLGLETLATHEGATLFMICLAAYQILLARWSGQRDIVVGTPIAGRARGEVEGLIGLFVNTLVLRTDLHGDPPFRQLLARVRQVTLDAYARQEVPFETLVRELQPDRDLSRQPILQTMLALQNYPEERLELPGLTWSWLDVDRTTAHFDLVLHLDAHDGGLAGMFSYASDLFDQTTVARLADSFQVLLASIVDHPEITIQKLPLLTDAERHKILVEWNATCSTYPEHCVHELFEAQVRSAPGAIAVVDGETAVSYDALNRKANRLARYLISRGVVPGEYVPVLMGRSTQLLVAELAVLKCGAAYVPIDPRVPAERREFMIQDCGAKRILIGEPLGSSEQSVTIESIDCSALDVGFDLLSGDDLEMHVDARSAAYAIYTSGSTGTPKGVLICHSSIARLVLGSGYADIGPADCIAHVSNPAFDASTFEMWSALLRGARLLIVPQETMLDEQRFGALLAGQRATVMLLTTGLFNQSSAVMRRAFTGLRYLLTGGDVIDTSAVARVLDEMRPEHLLNAYGPTECTVIATTYEIREPREATSRIPIGRPIGNTQLYILDEYLQPVPVGVPGELYLAGPGLALGYLNRPGLTAQRFIANPFSTAANARMYQTGDLVRWRSDGAVEFLGRNDHQVKIRGFRIELGEIELCLSRHPQVRDVAVLALEMSGDKRLVAYVTAAAGEAPSIEQMREHLKACLPAYMVPSAFMVLDELPLTPIGKLDRRALPIPSAASSVSEQYAAPEGEFEQELADVWQQLLGVQRVGRDDNFFEMGGHSLQGIKLIAQVADRFAVRLSGAAIFQYPTVRQMAAAVERGARDQTLQLVRHEADRVPLAYSQLAHWRTYRLSERPAIRQIASATRLFGRVDVAVLRRCIEEIVRRYDTLRTQIATDERGRLVQHISGSVPAALSVIDLSALSQDAREARFMSLVDEAVMQPVDVAVDRLWTMRLVHLAEREQALIVAMEHMICDEASLGILLRELWTAYDQLAAGDAIRLPPVSTQFAAFAASQRSAESAWLEKHAAYWGKVESRFRLLHFPRDEHLHLPRAGWETVRLVIGKDLRTELEAWCRAQRTTLVMSVFTAYSALLLRWCGASQAVIRYQTDGRSTPGLENVIGYFATALYVGLELQQADDFLSLLERVTAAYCEAFEHADGSYLAAQAVPPDFIKNPGFNWIPRASWRSMPSEAAAGLIRQPIRFAHPMLRSSESDNEPSVLCFDLEDEIHAEVMFPMTRFSRQTMQAFIDNLGVMLIAMIRTSRSLITQVRVSPQSDQSLIGDSAGVSETIENCSSP